MKVGIMQPYFFPYLGYIGLIKHTDAFILFDGVQFIRHGWIERNRILKPNEGWQYISVALKKASSRSLIQDTHLNNEQAWQEKIFAQLQHYKKKSPYYRDTIELIKDAFSKPSESITQLNCNCLESVCAYLGVPFRCGIYSQMSLQIEEANTPDEWALNICKALGYNEYWNPTGGMEFFDRSKYEAAGIKLQFMQPALPFYSQRRGPENFENGLSIIDVMMFNSPEAICQILDDYELI